MLAVDCRSLLLLIVTAVLSSSAVAQSTLIPLTTHRDMVFDHGGTFLYISTSDGFVRRYNIGTGAIDASYSLGGSLNGLDISPDGSFLIVAQSATNGGNGTFHRLDLKTGEVTNITYPRASGEDGGWDVAIGSHGRALVTTQGNFWTPVRQINLATNAITLRLDAPGSFDNMPRPRAGICRSADGSRFYFLEPGVSSGPVFTYSTPTNTFGPSFNSNQFQSSATAAVSRDGSFVLTKLATSFALDTAPSFRYQRSLFKFGSAVAFDPQFDRLYATAPVTQQIVALDANTFVELFRVNVGEVPVIASFDTASISISPDSRYVAVPTSSGIRLVTLPSGAVPPPPSPAFGTPRDLVFDHAGERLYITTAEGLVWPYEIALRTLGTPYRIGGALNGVDIAPDDSFLIVAQEGHGVAQGTFQKLNLATGEITDIKYERGSGSLGSWDIAIASNGLAFATTGNAAFSGSTSPLRQIDLATNSITTRNVIPRGTVDNGTTIQRSADRSRVGFMEPSSTSGTVFTYSAATDSFGPSLSSGLFFRRAVMAISRDGGLVATPFDGSTQVRSTTVWTAPDFNFVHRFGAINRGMAFDAFGEVVYGISSYSNQIVAYDTVTFAERFRFDVGANFADGDTQFGGGLLVPSQDGQHLALNVGTEVRVYTVPAVQLVGVASVKFHDGTAYAIDLPLDGPRAVESRTGGSNGAHTIVFTFGQNLISVGGAAVTNGTGSVTGRSIDPTDPRRCVVNLTGVTNRQTVKVTLSDLADAVGNRTELISTQMGVLVGDTNGNGTVNASDVSETKAQSGQPLSAQNFRADANASGAINASDIGLVKSQAGMTVPGSGGSEE